VSDAPVIYLLDDDSSFLRSLSRLLAAEGYVTRSFVTVVEFLQAAASEPTRLVVLDYMMPGLTGLQVQDCLRSFAPETRVIMISAANLSAIRDQALRAGACACFFKPFDDETFLKAVRDALAMVIS
jgi:two-component system, LuxR family, response regulator FixJ